jgi:hypothetical protein
MWLLVTSQFNFIFSRVEVSQDLVFIPIKNEEGRTVTSVIYGFCLSLSLFASCHCAVHLVCLDIVRSECIS